MLTMRAYCLVDRWPEPLQRLGKRESSNLSPSFLEIGARRRERQSIHFVPLSTSTGLPDGSFGPRLRRSPLHLPPRFLRTPPTDSCRVARVTVLRRLFGSQDSLRSPRNFFSSGSLSVSPSEMLTAVRDAPPALVLALPVDTPRPGSCRTGTQDWPVLRGRRPVRRSATQSRRGSRRASPLIHVPPRCTGVRRLLHERHLCVGTVHHGALPRHCFAGAANPSDRGRRSDFAPQSCNV